VKALDALHRHKRTIEELQGILQTSRTAVRIYMTTLRKKGYVIKKVGSYYRLYN
jgi:biotin operon repressor